MKTGNVSYMWLYEKTTQSVLSIVVWQTSFFSFDFTFGAALFSPSQGELYVNIDKSFHIVLDTGKTTAETYCQVRVLQHRVNAGDNMLSAGNILTEEMTESTQHLQSAARLLTFKCTTFKLSTLPRQIHNSYTNSATLAPTHTQLDKGSKRKRVLFLQNLKLNQLTGMH